MNFKQAIRIGRSIDGIFRLPCVASVRKDLFGTSFFELYGHCMLDRKNAIAREGDWLCEDKGRKWVVLNNEQYNKIRYEQMDK